VQGTYRFPVVCDGQVVFVCEDDLWACPLEGGVARRLTALRGHPTHLAAHPELPLVAFTSSESGVRDVYLLDLSTGVVERLTHHGGASVAGWTSAGEVALSSSRDRPFARDRHLYAVSPEGGSVRDLGLGPGLSLWCRDDGRQLVGRYRDELTSWQGYRGGRRGEVWVRSTDGATRMADGDGGLATPAWLGDEVVAAADASGRSQLCRLDPVAPPTPLTDHDQPVRAVQPCSGGVVYSAGPDLYRFDADSGEAERVDVRHRSSRPQRDRRFVRPGMFLEGVEPHPDGARVAVVVRGKPFVGGWFEGPMRQLGERHGVRYRLPRWVADDQLVLCSDRGGAERLEVHHPGGTVRELDSLDGGRPIATTSDPAGERLAVVDHRRGLWLVPVDGGEATAVHRGPGGAFHPAFSHDGRWLAYAREVGRRGGATEIVVTPVAGGEDIVVTSGRYRDLSPSFDPEGRYLYLVSFRVFDPSYDGVRFGLSFPRGSRPYAVTLQADAPDPFRHEPMPLKRPSKRPKPPAELTIDADGIGARIVAFPVAESRYLAVVGAAGGRVWMLRRGVTGSSNRRMRRRNPPPTDRQLVHWQFDKAEVKIANPRVSGVSIDRTGRHLAVRVGSRLRLAPAAPDKSQLDELRKNEVRYGRPRGFFDLSRLRVAIDPPAEWRQMLEETGRLMAHHHWQGGPDAPRLLEAAREELPRVACRSELSDLLRRFHGGFKTSHAYEVGGDHRRPPRWRPGRLAADLAWDEARGAWRIERVIRGEVGDPDRRSPLVGPGRVVPEGAWIVAVDGLPVRRDRPVDAMLAHRGGTEVSLLVDDGDHEREVVVTPLRDDRAVRYRQWVLDNRRHTHARSDGRVGYVHVPNMGPTGFAEFHRDHLTEAQRDALLVDVRWNTGGHVGQLLLGTLTRPPLGWVVPRWGEPYVYPNRAVAGPMAALANEHSGSDGDMFTHLWKRLGLGPVFGVPTWGGTVGIIARHYLADGSLVTQPEFAQWFDDVGFGLENRGAIPDHEVPIPPGTRGDPQLDAAVDWLVDTLARRPSTPRPPRAGP